MINKGLQLVSSKDLKPGSLAPEAVPLYLLIYLFIYFKGMVNNFKQLKA